MVNVSAPTKSTRRLPTTTPCATRPPGQTACSSCPRLWSRRYAGHGQVTRGGSGASVKWAVFFSCCCFPFWPIRLWRRFFTLTGGKPGNLLQACAVSILAGCLGYFSIRHSLSLLYSGYGERAFAAGNLPAAFTLFQKSSGYSSSADAMGKQGVCLLLSGRSGEGLRRLAGAKALRHGRLTPFEEFSRRTALFFSGSPTKQFRCWKRHRRIQPMSGAWSNCSLSFNSTGTRLPMPGG